MTIVLSRENSASYVKVGAYNLAVENFGKRLADLIYRLDAQHVDIAAKGLPAAATDAQRQAFSNYISRMAKGRVKNPGLVQLERLAQGLGLTLSAFFLQLEGSPTRALHPLSESATSARTPAHVASDPGGARVDSSVPATDRLKETLEEFGARLLLIARDLPEPHQQDRPGRASEPAQSGRARKDRR